MFINFFIFINHNFFFLSTTTANQSQFVNGNSQRVITSPGQVPPSTGSQSGQPPVAPKPNRVETNNRANVDAMLHELDHGVPPPPAG